MAGEESGVASWSPTLQWSPRTLKMEAEDPVTASKSSTIQEAPRTLRMEAEDSVIILQSPRIQRLPRSLKMEAKDSAVASQSRRIQQSLRTLKMEAEDSAVTTQPNREMPPVGSGAPQQGARKRVPTTSPGHTRSDALFKKTLFQESKKQAGLLLEELEKAVTASSLDSVLLHCKRRQLKKALQRLVACMALKKMGFQAHTSIIQMWKKKASLSTEGWKEERKEQE